MNITRYTLRHWRPQYSSSNPCFPVGNTLFVVVQHTHKHIFLILIFFRYYFYIFACLVLGVIAAVCSAVCGYIRRVRGERLVSHEHNIIAFPSGYRHIRLLKHFEVYDIISYETTFGSILNGCIIQHGGCSEGLGAFKFCKDMLEGHAGVEDFLGGIVWEVTRVV